MPCEQTYGEKKINLNDMFVSDKLQVFKVIRKKSKRIYDNKCRLYILILCSQIFGTSLLFIFYKPFSENKQHN